MLGDIRACLIRNRNIQGPCLAALSVSLYTQSLHTRGGLQEVLILT